MTESKQFILDELDKRILIALQDDAARTNQELAELVHVSAPTCLRRVKRLQGAGVITRQVAILNPEKVGAGLTAIVEITLDIQSSEKLIEFEKTVVHEVAIQQCYRVSPGPDFVVIIQVADMPAYHTLAHRLFANQKTYAMCALFFRCRAVNLKRS